jgi:hypothetical protein
MATRLQILNLYLYFASHICIHVETEAKDVVYELVAEQQEQQVAPEQQDPAQGRDKY